MLTVIGWIFIFISGCITGTFFSLKYYKKSLIKIEAFIKDQTKGFAREIDESIKYGINLGIVNEKINNVALLNQKQGEMVAQLNTPNHNASHARWKRSILNDIIAIEEEKIEILESIIKDGKDYAMMTQDEEGKPYKTTVSEIVKQMKFHLEQQRNGNKNTAKPNLPEIKIKPKLKLITNEEKTNESIDGKIS